MSIFYHKCAKKQSIPYQNIKIKPQKYQKPTTIAIFNHRIV